MPVLTCAEGALFIYPTFIVSIKKREATIMDINKIDISCSSVVFAESEALPPDSKLLYYTWEKANYDGSRDKRFKNNFRIPVVEYGELHIFSSKYKINEHFYVSNYTSALNCAVQFEKYKKSIPNKSKYC